MKTLIALVMLLHLFSCSSTPILSNSRQHEKADRYVEKAKKYTELGDDKNAEKYVDYALEISNAYNFSDVKTNALLIKSSLSAKKNQWDKAIDAIKSANEISMIENPELLPFVKMSEASLYWELGKRDKAKDIIDEIKNAPSSLEPAILNFKAMIKMEGKNYQVAKDLATTALDKADANLDYIEKSASLKILARLAIIDNDNETALKYVTESHTIDKKTANIKMVIWDIEFLGDYYLKKGDKQKAHYYYSQGYDASVKQNQHSKIHYFSEKMIETNQ